MADGTGSRRPYKNYLDQDVDLIDFDEEDSCKLLPRSTAHNRKRKASTSRPTVVETDSELESDELDLESMISTCSSSSTPTTINIRHDREDELDHEEADREHQANFVSGSAHDNAENTDTGPDDHDDGTDHGAMPMDGAVPVAMDPVPELIEEESHNVHDAGPLHVPEEGGILGIILDEFHQLQNEADESDGGEFSEVEEPEADAGQCEPDAGHCQEDGGNIHVPGGDEPVSSEERLSEDWYKAEMLTRTLFISVLISWAIVKLADASVSSPCTKEGEVVTRYKKDPHRSFGSGSTRHDVAKAVCSNPDAEDDRDAGETDAIAKQPDGTEDAVHRGRLNDVRLARGHTPTPNEGFVQVLYSNQWQFVCSRYWSFKLSNMTCHSLGYTTALLPSDGQIAYRADAVAEEVPGILRLVCPRNTRNLTECGVLPITIDKRFMCEDNGIAMVTCEKKDEAPTKSPPEGWHTLDDTDTVYSISSSPVSSFSEASTICQGYGASLVKIDSGRVNTFLAEHARSITPGAVWIGLCYDFGDERWEWMDGTPLGYNNWWGDPDEKLSTDTRCALMEPTGWWTVKIPPDALFICQKGNFDDDDDDRCDPNPCLHGGTCQHSPNTTGYSCKCAEGFLGETCYLGSSCLAFKEAGLTESGIYQISPMPTTHFNASCDLSTDGGGWVVIQRRTNGDVTFNRNWQGYQKGFGSLTGDHWLGLDYIHSLTSTTVELRVTMITWSDPDQEISSSFNFRVDETYQGHFSDTSVSQPTDVLEFSTTDHGDMICALRHGGGGYWYDKHSQRPSWRPSGHRSNRPPCTLHNVNGHFVKSGSFCQRTSPLPDSCYANMYWSTTSQNAKLLKSVEMKIRKI